MKNHKKEIIVPYNGELLAIDVLKNNGYEVATYNSPMMHHWTCEKESKCYKVDKWTRKNGKTIGIKIELLN